MKRFINATVAVIGVACLCLISVFAGSYDSVAVSCYADGVSSGTTFGPDYGFYGGIAFGSSTGTGLGLQIPLSGLSCVPRSGGVDYRLDVDQSWLSGRPDGQIPSGYGLTLLLLCDPAYELDLRSRLCSIIVTELNALPDWGHVIAYPSGSILDAYDTDLEVIALPDCRIYRVDLSAISSTTTTLDVYGDISAAIIPDDPIDSDYVGGFGDSVNSFYDVFGSFFDSELVLSLLGIVVGAAVVTLVIRWVVA